VLKFLLIFLVLLADVTIDGTRKGREGNKKYYSEDYQNAEQSFIKGLEGLSASEKSRTSSGLYNNLGCALNKQKKFEEAADVLQKAISTASSAEESSRAHFNSGNNLVQMQQLDAALDMYKEALLADPKNEAARFNYEFVKRLKNEQQEQNSGQNQQEQENQDQQQNQDQQNQQNQNQNQNQQEQNQDQQQGENEDQNDQQEQPQNPNQMSQEEAQRILQKLQSDEKELLKQSKKVKGTGKKSKKDW